MAGRLYEFTGINPLTINQTKYSERSKQKLNDPLLKALNLKESSILLNQNNESLNYKRNESFTDIAVLHPNTKYKNARPNWLFDLQKREVKIELKDLNISFPVMVLAYLKNEDIHSAVPIDIIEIQHKNEMGYLALKNKNYNIVINNKSGKSLKFEMKVK